jgi:hypothetical protein
VFLIWLIIRDFVSEVMHVHDPDGFDLREPTAKRLFRVPTDPVHVHEPDDSDLREPAAKKLCRGPKVPIGIKIHERWAGDGHDKLYKIGFPVWVVVDDATSKWLGAWVVPCNRLNDIIAYLFLCLVEKFGGSFIRVPCFASV